MRHFGRVVAFIGGLLFLLATARQGGAADQAAADKVKAFNKAAAAAYETGNFGKMKAQLNKAMALADKSGLTADPVVAETYALFAVLQVEDLEDQKAGVTYFSKAL